MALKYPQFEQSGNLLILWMESASERGCPVQMSNLSALTLPQPMDWHIEHDREWLSPERISSIVGLGLPLGELVPNDLYPTESPCLRHSVIKTIGGVTALVGTIAPGVLFLYSIRRTRLPSNDPYVSQLAKMAYETHFPLDGLKSTLPVRDLVIHLQSIKPGVVRHRSLALSWARLSVRLSEPSFFVRLARVSSELHEL